MCGNNKFHRSGFVGSVYRLFMERFPDWVQHWAPKCCRSEGKGGCLGRGGPCRYFIFGFYFVIYSFFIVVYLSCVDPNLKNLYAKHLALHRLLSYLVLPWPWVIFVLLQFYDPGEITRENVKSYIDLYPLDRVLYFPKVCPTLRLPVVARSRFCRYSERRIASVLLLTPENTTTTALGSSPRSVRDPIDSSSSSS
jgi:hypothetical protein